MLHLNSSKYFLTEFSGDWAHEANVTERELAFGKKVIDTKLGARANMFVSPFFQAALDNPSQENAGEVLVGTIGWTGNFRFTFEVDNKTNCVLSAVSTRTTPNTACPPEKCSVLRTSISLTARRGKVRPAVTSMTGRAIIR